MKKQILLTAFVAVSFLAGSIGFAQAPAAPAKDTKAKTTACCAKDKKECKDTKACKDKKEKCCKDSTKAKVQKGKAKAKK